VSPLKGEFNFVKEKSSTSWYRRNFVFGGDEGDPRGREEVRNSDRPGRRRESASPSPCRRKKGGRRIDVLTQVKDNSHSSRGSVRRSKKGVHVKKDHVTLGTVSLDLSAIHWKGENVQVPCGTEMLGAGKGGTSTRCHHPSK